MLTLSRSLLLVVGTLTLAAGLTACDNFEDNLDFEAGDSRTVIGASSVAVAPEIEFTADTTTTGVTVTSVNVETNPTTTSDYYVQAFTTGQAYAWSVEGPGNPTGVVRRDGEYYDVTFGTRGAYTVTVSDGTYTGTEAVEVTEPPSVGACTASSSSLVRDKDDVTYQVIEGDPVTFDAVVASRLPATVSVNYGEDGPDADEEIDMAQNVTLPVTREYTKPGTFSVVLTAKNEDGTDSCTISVEVLPAATVSECTATPKTVRLGQAITFDATVSGVVDPTVVSIAYGNGVVNPNATLPEQYTYPAIGTYTTTITGTNARGESACSVDVEVVQ